MLNRTFQMLLAGCLMTGPLWAADNPFVGKWKVNPSKSMLNDEMKVELAGANRYAITFGPGQVDTVTADGSDQPALSGTTLSITVKGPNSWEICRKMKGRTLLRAYWTLSEDGKTLDDAFTQYLPDGTTLFSQSLPNGSTLFYEGDGLSFKRSDEETAKMIKFDGNDYPELVPNGGDKGIVYSGRRVNELSLEITEKLKGKITGARQIELSPDLKTLTVTVRLVGQSKPQSIHVYNRE